MKRDDTSARKLQNEVNYTVGRISIVIKYEKEVYDSNEYFLF